MFLNNPRGPKDTVESLFQSYGEHKDQQRSNTKHDQEMDNNIVTFNQMEKNAEHHALHSYTETIEEEKKLEQLLQTCATHQGGMGLCKMFQVDELKGGEPLTEEMQKVKEAELRELKARELLCRDSSELSEMNTRLHQAALRKDHALQMEEKEHKKQEDKIVDQFYRDQLCSATQRQILEAEAQEDSAARRKAEYKKALEQQMADEAEAKKEAKYRLYLEEQQLSQRDIDRMMEEDKVTREEKLTKILQLRGDMQEALKSRELGRQEEKMKNQRLEENVLSYWEQSSRHEQELRQEQQNRQQQITERQEQCAQSLQQINQRKQTRSDLMDNINVLTQQASQETNDRQQDVDEVDRKLRQTELCSDLDEQVADKVRAKRNAKQQSGDFQETWIWGSDAATHRGDQAEKLRKQRECADYNRATVREHEEFKKTNRHCDGGENKENAAEGVFKRRLSDEEKDRLLKGERELSE